MKKHRPIPDAPKPLEVVNAPSFPLGQVIVTDGALALLDRAGLNANDVLNLHQGGAWRDFGGCEVLSDELVIGLGLRLYSAYQLRATEEKLWVITDPEQGTTTLLVPKEFVRRG